MAYLTRAQILAADDRPFTTLEVPEWGGAVRIASLSIRERGLLRAALKEKKDEDGTGEAMFLSRCLVDEAGLPLFSEEDIEALASKGGAVITRVFDAAWEWNGLSEKAVAEAKNSSAPTPNGATSSTSPTASDASPENWNVK